MILALLCDIWNKCLNPIFGRGRHVKINPTVGGRRISKVLELESIHVYNSSSLTNQYLFIFPVSILLDDCCGSERWGHIQPPTIDLRPIKPILLGLRTSVNQKHLYGFNINVYIYNPATNRVKVKELRTFHENSKELFLWTSLRRRSLKKKKLCANKVFLTFDS